MATPLWGQTRPGLGWGLGYVLVIFGSNHIIFPIGNIAHCNHALVGMFGVLVTLYWAAVLILAVIIGISITFIVWLADMERRHHGDHFIRNDIICHCCGRPWPLRTAWGCDYCMCLHCLFCEFNEYGLCELCQHNEDDGILWLWGFNLGSIIPFTGFGSHHTSSQLTSSSPPFRLHLTYM